jgi:hypothetical protein
LAERSPNTDVSRRVPSLPVSVDEFETHDSRLR